MLTWWMFAVTAGFPVTLIASLGCTDADSGSNGALTYSIVQSPGVGDFSATNGVVKLESKWLVST